MWIGQTSDFAKTVTGMDDPRHVAALHGLFSGADLDPAYRRRLLDADLIVGRNTVAREVWVVYGHEVLTALRNRARVGASESVDVLVIDYDRHNSTEQAMVEFAVFDTRGLTAIVQDEQFLNHWADS